MNSRRNKSEVDIALFGLWLVLALGVGAAALGLVWAGQNTLEKFQASLTRLKTLNDLRSNANQAESELRRVQHLDSILTGFGGGLPAGTEGAFVLDLLMRNAESCSLSIKHLQAWEEKPGQEFRELPFDITVQGGFMPVHRFMEELGDRPWALRLHHAEMKSEALNLNRITATFQFSVFVHHPGTQPVSGSIP
jgi:Tfp pilus assembly protein PilO